MSEMLFWEPAHHFLIDKRGQVMNFSGPNSSSVKWEEHYHFVHWAVTWGINEETSLKRSE